MVRGPGKFLPFAIAVLVFLLDVPIGYAHVPDVENSDSMAFIGGESSTIPSLICDGEECQKDRKSSTPSKIKFLMKRRGDKAIKPTFQIQGAVPRRILLNRDVLAQ